MVMFTNFKRVLTKKIKTAVIINRPIITSDPPREDEMIGALIVSIIHGIKINSGPLPIRPFK